MPDLRLILSLVISSTGLADSSLPRWVTSGPVADSSYYYVICSEEGLDPQLAQDTAEGKCLSSAAKLGGVTVDVSSKTIQSISGADSNEVVELLPIKRDVKCEWVNRFLESKNAGYRIWLQCKVSKRSVSLVGSSDIKQSKIISSIPYKRALITISTIPRADVVIIGGSAGERAVEVTSNAQNVELKEGDEWLIAKKHTYKDTKVELSDWSHGDTLSQVIKLVRSF